MALELSETAYTPVNARPVRDDTGLRALEVAAPILTEATVGYAEGQIAGEIAGLNASLQRTQEYVTALKGQAAALDPADQESLAASEELGREINRTLKGQTQGMMTPAEAEARVASKVRELSRRFPVAAANLRSFVSGGTSSVLGGAAMNQLEQEQKQLARVEEAILKRGIDLGFDVVNNPNARDFILREMRRRTAIENESQLLGLEKQRIEYEEALFKESTRGMRFSREAYQTEKAGIEVRAARRGEQQTALETEEQNFFVTFKGNTQRFLGSFVSEIQAKAPKDPETGGFADPGAVVASIRSLFAKRKELILSSTSSMLYVDTQPYISSLDNWEESLITSVQDGSAAKLYDSYTTLANSKTNYITSTDFASSVLLKNLLGTQGVTEYFKALGSGSFETVSAMQRVIGANPETIQSTITNFARGQITAEQARDLIQASKTLLNSTDSLDPEASRIFLNAADALNPGNIRAFWDGGVRIAMETENDYTRLQNYFNSETESIADNESVKRATASGSIQFTYDNNTKTLLVKNRLGQYVQHYSLMDAGSSLDQQNASSKLKRFLDTVPGYAEQVQKSSRIAAAMATNPLEAAMTDTELAPLIDFNILRRMTEQLQTLSLYKSKLDATQESYFNQIRTQGQQ